MSKKNKSSGRGSSYALTNTNRCFVVGYSPLRGDWWVFRGPQWELVDLASTEEMRRLYARHARPMDHNRSLKEILSEELGLERFTSVVLEFEIEHLPQITRWLEALLRGEGSTQPLFVSPCPLFYDDPCGSFVLWAVTPHRDVRLFWEGVGLRLGRRAGPEAETTS